MAAYGLAAFTSAFLLFQIQPLMGRYLLPLFGGVPAVWTACLLFFQLVLLAGYGYAHLSVRWLKPRVQVLLHLGLLAVALATLRINPNAFSKALPGTQPILQILLLLSLSIGLPYFVLAATAPLVQSWMRRTHAGISPFRLYALSNVASLLALASYPTFFENHFSRPVQAGLWLAGLWIYTFACLGAGIFVWKTAKSRDLEQTPRPAAKPPARNRLLWLLLPACASLLLLAVTNILCQDIAAIPFLWVLPLTVYLLSFIICFAGERFYDRRIFGLGLFAVLAVFGTVLSGILLVSTAPQVAIYVAGLFVCCMVCHGEVYRLRPDPANLTGFYLRVTAGGAIGAVFVAVVAPLIFKDYFELHWGIILCGMLFLVLCAPQRKPGRALPPLNLSWAVGCLFLIGLSLLLWHAAHLHDQIRLARTRNFYGVLNVFRHDFDDPKFSLVELVHGRVAHGVQFLDPSRASRPTLYYAPSSGIGRALTALPGGHRRIGIVGLGAGTLAAYGQTGDQIVFYEINPEVELIARNHFSYLRNSAAKVTVVLGDARLALEREPRQNFDLLALDAFNSDSIPMHLLTREAFGIYQRHLTANGVLAVNISNRSLDLEPVISRLADTLGLQGVVVQQPENNELEGILPSTWLLFAHNREFAETPPLRGVARALRSMTDGSLWTDDFSSMFSVFRWRESSLPRSTTVAARSAVPQRPKAKVALAILQLRQAVERDPNSAPALNNLACLLATAADPQLRDGTEAVRLAERASALTQNKNTSVLSTLAAAYAETGRFDEAVATAEKARALAAANGEQQLLDGNKRMIEFYRRKEPFHQAQ
jgi:tetratricopeptide (TPR) repeat protein